MNIYSIINAAFQNTRFTALDGEKPELRDGRLFVPSSLLRCLAEECFRSIAFYFRESHLACLAGALVDPASSANDRITLKALLKNALIAAKGELALCQDTGTAVVYGWKPEAVFTGGCDAAELEAGTAAAYLKNHLRASQVAPLSFFEEYNTGNNLPAQIRIEAVPCTAAGLTYRFLFAAKGGGSSNKTSLFSMSKALLEEKTFEEFLEDKIRSLGTAACPPYRIAVVIGGTSPEINLDILKLATTEILDKAPYFEEYKGPLSPLLRDTYWEEKVLEIGRKTGIGAQFGGRQFLLDARVIRMPRHAASCPVSIGVSCSAHRNMLAYIDRNGAYVEELCRDPGRFLDSYSISLPDLSGVSDDNRAADRDARAGVYKLDLNLPLQAVRAGLDSLRIGDRLSLCGKLLVARDAAHLKWHELILAGKELPQYLSRHPIYYAGPAATPPGMVIGSLGPTTAQRMDRYAEELMSRGVSLITLAKGNRGGTWTEACKKYGGFYLGTIGGAAALLAEENVVAGEVLDYPELGMEAVRLIEVRELSAFIIVDNKGNELY
ncbi:MAG: FumA C-terminus/TtdB family hydratase beta subunit [Treponema sp.]|jgi:fumarate hydratase class I|nr:FumA C-terminus/TtdB family hydratase beta subunit [Treponema sp.]